MGVGSLMVLFYNYKNKLFGGRLISRLGTIPHVVIFVTVLCLAAVIFASVLVHLCFVSGKKGGDVGDTFLPLA